MAASSSRRRRVRCSLAAASVPGVAPTPPRDSTCTLSATGRCLLRWFIHRRRAMVNSHVLNRNRSSKRSRFASTRTKVSCARSSASSRLPHRRLRYDCSGAWKCPMMASMAAASPRRARRTRRCSTCRSGTAIAGSYLRPHRRFQHLRQEPRLTPRPAGARCPFGCPRPVPWRPGPQAPAPGRAAYGPRGWRRSPRPVPRRG